ncbi:MAG TPA: macro domain-containing protein [Mariprofundaceae bacterium]|nr:macro domain-containing protein [Mariprofundaceae bacterium]
MGHPYRRAGLAGWRIWEDAKLADCYRHSLSLTEEVDAASIVFPAISCGVYGFPLGQAADIAVREVRGYLKAHPESFLQRVVFAVSMMVPWLFIGRRWPMRG